jgi:TRAP-type C4-dicarboxylate transport system substrate-binding protein
MKKLFILVLAIVVMSCLLLGACTKSTPTPTPTTKPAASALATTAPATTAPTTTASPTPSKPIELVFSYHAPPQSSLAKAIFVPWCADIEAATGGRVKIIQQAGGALLSSEDEYDGVVKGICDIAQVNTEDYPGRFPLSAIHVLPYMYPSTEMAGIVGHETFNKYLANTELKDVKILIAAPLFTSHWFGKKPLEKLEDFKGLKIRATGKMWGDIITALGGTPVEVATADVSSALDTGMIDGTFFTWSGAMAFGIETVTKYRTIFGASQDIHLIVMNKNTFNKLPPDIQKIFNDYCTPETSRKYAAAHAALEPGARGAIIGKDKAAGNPGIFTPSDAEMARWKAAVSPIRARWATDRGPTAISMLEFITSQTAKYSK